MLLWESSQSSAQLACYLPSLSQYPCLHLRWEEYARVKCLAQGHNTQLIRGLNSQTWDRESLTLLLSYPCRVLSEVWKKNVVKCSFTVMPRWVYTYVVSCSQNCTPIKMKCMISKWMGALAQWIFFHHNSTITEHYHPFSYFSTSHVPYFQINYSQ